MSDDGRMHVYEPFIISIFKAYEVLRVSEKLAAGSIRDEISRPLYAP
jgi:hypothetical protein